MREVLDKIASFFKKAWAYLKNPPTFIKVITFLSALVCVGGAMTILIIGYTGNIVLEIVAYVFFGLSAITFS